MTYYLLLHFDAKETTLYERKKNRLNGHEKFSHKILVDEQIYNDKRLPKISVTESHDNMWYHSSTDSENEEVKWKL